MPICSYCNHDGRLAAKGLCGTCYARFRRNGTAEPLRFSLPPVERCSYCETPDGPFIKGLCRACYQQQYKTGSPERQRVCQLCEYPGCDEPVAAKGFCQKHSMRIRRHGTADPTRPTDWGSRAKHPLYERWKSMNRGARGQVVPEWSDFWRFVADVGESPSAEHRLYRISDGEPYGPHNTEWRCLIGKYSASDRAAKNAYMREHRRQRPRQHREAYLRRHYGVTGEWYDQRIREQGGVCAICREPEIIKHHMTGETMLLAVDHCHDTGAPRGLLCSACNTSIGLMKHMPERFRSAIAYLDSHKGEPDVL